MGNSVRLPNWLDALIYKELGGTYSPTRGEMTVIDWPREEVLRYLGTYFPRSYAEAYTIVSEHLGSSDAFAGRESVSLFDFGCGTGGEIVGAVCALSERRPAVKRIDITGLDGNQHALRLCESIIARLDRQVAPTVTFKPAPVRIDDLYDLGIVERIMPERFDMVLSFKAVCEFVSKERFEKENAYEALARFFLPRIGGRGFLLLVDVTSRYDATEEWLPHMMDRGLRAAGVRDAARNKGYNQIFRVSHSHQDNDESKVAWRLISR